MSHRAAEAGLGRAVGILFGMFGTMSAQLSGGARVLFRGVLKHRLPLFVSLTLVHWVLVVGCSLWPGLTLTRPPRLAPIDHVLLQLGIGQAPSNLPRPSGHTVGRSVAGEPIVVFGADAG